MQNHRETILVLNNQTTGFEKRGKKKGTRSKNPSSILVSASKCLGRRKQEKKKGSSWPRLLRGTIHGRWPAAARHNGKIVRHPSKILQVASRESKEYRYTSKLLRHESLATIAIKVQSSSVYTPVDQWSNKSCVQFTGPDRRIRLESRGRQPNYHQSSSVKHGRQDK